MGFKAQLIIVLMTMSAVIFALDAQSGTDQEWNKAEEFFNQGEYNKCTEFLEKYIRNESGKNNTEKLKRSVAMLEYIRRNDKDFTEGVLKDAEKLSADKTQDADKKLKTLEHLLATAADWKERSVPEWIALTDLMLKALASIKSGTDGSLALRILLIRSELLYLRGEFQTAVEELNEAAKHYYPKDFKTQSLAAAQKQTAAFLLFALGKQYEALGMSALEKKDKEKYFSAAGVAYLKAVDGFAPDTPEYDWIVERIFKCADALKLLGYQLKIPAALAQIETKGLPMIQEMIAQKRYAGVMKITAFELEKIPNGSAEAAQLLFFKLKAQAGLKNYDDCANTAGQLAPHLPKNMQMIPELMQTASEMKQNHARKAALILYEVLASCTSGEADFAQIISDCAELSLSLGNVPAAAGYFERLASESRSNQIRLKAYLNSARCRYELGEYTKSYTLADKALSLTDVQNQDSFESGLIYVQAAVHCEKNAEAEAKIFELLKNEKMDSKTKGKISLLAAIIEQRMNKLEKADAFYMEYLASSPETPNFFEILGFIRKIRLNAKKYDDVSSLCEFAVKTHPDDMKIFDFILETACMTLAVSDVDHALAVHSKILDIPRIPPELLLKSASELESEDYDSARRKADLLEYGILSRKKAEYSNDKTVKETYYRLAAVLFRIGKYTEAEECVNLLQNGEKPYRYGDVKMLQAEIFKKKEHFKEAARIYQELALRNIKDLNGSMLAYLTAEACALGGEHKKAVAFAWTLIPADGNFPDGKKPNEWCGKALRLIVSSAKEINAENDAGKAAGLYRKIFNSEFK